MTRLVDTIVNYELFDQGLAAFTNSPTVALQWADDGRRVIEVHRDTDGQVLARVPWHTLNDEAEPAPTEQL